MPNCRKLLVHCVHRELNRKFSHGSLKEILYHDCKHWLCWVLASCHVSLTPRVQQLQRRTTRGQVENMSANQTPCATANIKLHYKHHSIMCTYCSFVFVFGFVWFFGFFICITWSNDYKLSQRERERTSSTFCILLLCAYLPRVSYNLILFVMPFLIGWKISVKFVWSTFPSGRLAFSFRMTLRSPVIATVAWRRNVKTCKRHSSYNICNRKLFFL